MLALGIVLTLLLLILGGVLVVTLGSFTLRQGRIEEELADPSSPTLDYVVPEGQDPAVVMTALAREGYRTAMDPHSAGHVLHIGTRAGKDRERAHVRATIAAARATSLGAGGPRDSRPVRFLDETG